MKLVEAPQEIRVYSKSYIAYQTSDSDLNEFFSYENHAYSPSLSLGGEIRKENKVTCQPALHLHQCLSQCMRFNQP